MSDVVLLEPVEIFIQEAWKRGTSSEKQTSSENPIQNPERSSFARWKGIESHQKSVTFFKGTLQDFDPSHPQLSTTRIGRVGYSPPSTASVNTSGDNLDNDLESGFDVIWCQWCLGHLDDKGLVAFFKRCRSALKDPEKSVIIVKENLCTDTDGRPTVVFDEDDSSLTR